MDPAFNKIQDQTESVYLSVVIPAYNEEKRIVKTLMKINEYLRKHPFISEIIIIDDGSTDRTISVVEDLLSRVDNLKIIMNGANHGKGYSVKRGFLNAKGKFLLFSDADLSTPIEEIEKLLIMMEDGYDIVIGSRGLKESDIKIHQPWYREAMGKGFNLLVRLFTLKSFKDTQCGFKCFTREVALNICKRQKIERFSFDVEMLYIAQKLGYKIKEVPVQWYHSPPTKVKAIRDSFQMFIDLLRIRINDLKGLYF